MDSAQDSKINLLPPSEFELSFWGKFLKWAVTTGRYVVIVTELIVIIAFLSRFKLDSELAGLTEDIRGKVNVLDAQTDTENRFLALQKRMAAVDTIMGASLGAGEEVSAVVRTVPVGVKLKDLNILKTEVILDANAAEDGNLGTMLKEITKNRQWKSVDVTSLNLDNTDGITWSLSIKR